MLIHAVVHAAGAQDRDGSELVMATLFGMYPFLLKLYADGGYQGLGFRPTIKKILAHVNIEIVKRSDHAKGFAVLPRRWVVERTFSWLGRCRRLAKDWENLNRMERAFLRLASIRLMLRKLCNPVSSLRTASQTIWHWEEVGSPRHSKQDLSRLMAPKSGEDVFIRPKPTRLVSRILDITANKDSSILDSFAGSGTTAHAVLEANRRDGSNRQFILVQIDHGEGKADADRLTAEQVRRVIRGYDFTGTQKTELLRERLNWRTLEKADELRHRVEAIEILHGHEYDRIRKKVTGSELVVTGEKSVAERTEGLGGEFTYCTLG